METDLATQSSVCEHSTRSVPAHNSGPPLLPTVRKPVGYATATHVQRGVFLAADLMHLGVDVSAPMATLQQAVQRLQQPNALPGPAAEALYLDVRRAIRKMSLANPLTAGAIATCNSATRAAEESWQELANGILGQVADFEGVGGVKIAGYVRKPAGPGPFPIVIVLHGGGPTARAVSDDNEHLRRKMMTDETRRASRVLG